MFNHLSLRPIARLCNKSFTRFSSSVTRPATLISGLILIQLIISGNIVKAQTYSWSNGGSDYSGTVSFGEMSQYPTDKGSTNWKWGKTTALYIRGKLKTAANLDFNDGKGINDNSASRTLNVGPGYSQTWTVAVHKDGEGCTSPAVYGACVTEGKSFDNSSDLAIGTAALKAPVQPEVTSAALREVNYISLSWVKGSNVPDSYLEYQVFRNGSLIATVAGDLRAYTDNGPPANITYNYTIKTHLNASGRGLWGNQTSPATDAVQGFIYKNDFKASKDLYGKVSLSWNDLSKFAEDIKVFRNGEELAVLNKSAKSYSDQEGVPGKKYLYAILPIKAGETFSMQTDSGYKKAIGKISGTVRSKQGSGVAGVTITTKTKIESIDYLYTTQTDDAGYYEITEMFFGAGDATFTITPSYPNHKFNPASSNRKLSLNASTASAVDFTDTTALSISGKIYFPATADVSVMLPVEGAEIFINGNNSGVKSKSDGTYSATVYDAGTYKVQLKFNKHKIVFDKAGNLNDSVGVVNVRSAVSGFNFIDKQTDTLIVKIQAGCDAPIGEYVNAVLSAKSLGESTATPGSIIEWKKTYTIHAADGLVNNLPNEVTNGTKTFILPATEFKTEIITVFTKTGSDNNKLEYFKSNYGPLSVNLAKRDSTNEVTQKTVVKHIPAVTVKLPNGSSDVISPARDTSITSSDTLKVIKAHQLDFIYHKDLKLTVDDADAFTLKDFAAGNTKKYLASQNDNPKLNIRLYEHYEYNGVSYDCPLDSGTIYIYDGISDLERQTFKISKGGLIKYAMKVGKPVLESPYQKKLQIVAVVGSKSITKEISVVVEGERPRNSTFVTKTPQIPFFVLHDPPGDLSSAKISKGTTFSTSVSTQYRVGGGAGAYVDAKVGAGTTLPFIGKIGADVFVGAKLEAGRDNTSSSTTTFNFTFNEEFSTSGEETLVGNDGDVFVGASLNMEYALTDVLRYDETKKDMVRDTSFAADYTGFNSTYLYTEYHIKRTLIPQLETILGLSTSKFNTALQQKNAGNTSITETTLVQLNKEMLENRANLAAWHTALTNNENARKTPTVRTLPDAIKSVVGGNISFSAGAIYDNSVTIDTLSANSTEFAVYVNTEAKIGLGIHAGDFNSLEAGGLMTVRMLDTQASGSSTQKSKTISYHLQDNDLGDFYSVGLFEDRRYGTPIFKTVTGSSSCPHEDNTQFRHLPAISVNGTNEQRNVPADQTAKFKVTIANRSESDETVEYAVKLDPLSNPNGARVLVGGQDVVNGQATFTIPTGKAFDLPVEVTKGPLSSTYEDLSLIMFSTCDNTLDDIDANVKSKPQVKLNAYFQSLCSSVDLFNPGNNWLLNQSNNNELYVAFSKYDASSGSLLTNVSLEYRKLNADFLETQWQTVVTIPKSQLNEKYYNYTFNVKGLDDGEYELRAVAVCASVDVTYSPVYRGKIDRKTAVAFGNPSPKNGILGIPDYIGVTFNKTISCDNQANPIVAKLTRIDNGKEIPVTFVCNGKDIEIRTIPENKINDYENVELKASLHNLRDLAGNVIKDTISWNLVVNRSSVFWDPVNVVLDATEGQTVSFKAKLRNKTATEQGFSLIKYPAWLRPTVKAGKVLPLGEVNIDFAVEGNLNTAQYTDTVIALVNNKRQYLFVEVNVLRSPPNWQVNAAKFKYNMSVTAQFSRNETDTLISKDIRDKIAVFVGNECRGFANIQYDDFQKKYVSFITAYSNLPNTEKLTFRLWDAYPGVEYQSNERLDFISGGVVGSTENPYIAHVEGVFQDIVLKKGWNWISLNVKHPDMTLKNVLASLKSTSGDLIKTLSNNAYSQYSSNLGWVGKLDSVSLYSSYMINVAHDDTLKVLGQIQRKPVKIQLNKGWSWVGYPMPVNIDLSTYLKNSSPADKDIVMSQDQFAQYNAATKSWSGSLQYLRPGKGYKMFCNSGISIPAFAPTDQDNDAAFITALINQPANTPIVYNNPKGLISSTIDPDIKVDATNFENNMSITAIINQDGDRMNDPARYEIRVLIDKQVVSISALTLLPNGLAAAFIPVYSKDNQEGKKIEVVVFDKQNQTQYPITISAVKNSSKIMGIKSAANGLAPVTVSTDIFQEQDKILGSIEAPKVFTLNGSADVELTSALNKQQVNLGDTLQYTYHIKNKGADAALNVKLTDVLNPSFDFISASNKSLDYNVSSREFNLAYPKLLSGERQEITISIRANKVGQFMIGNSLVVLDNDKVSSNNTAAALPLIVVDKRAGEARIFIPGLFSPNGDGINDQFVIVGLNDYYVSNKLVIYNKNYNQVYQKYNYQNDWTGDGLPVGSYGYLLKAVNSEGKEKVFKGYITIAY
jgi:uncharacterized repeat protein (TIGR01451 family)